MAGATSRYDVTTYIMSLTIRWRDVLILSTTQLGVSLYLFNVVYSKSRFDLTTLIYNPD